MSGYRYADQKAWLGTANGQRTFLKMRDWALPALKLSGAVMADRLMTAADAGDDWHALACIDRMVELGELREVTAGDVAGQHRVYVKAGR